MPYFVYILRDSSNKLYIGQTNNLGSRVNIHQKKDWKAAKFTKDNNGFSLVYYEAYNARIKAMKREIQLKGWTRAKKEALIEGNVIKLKELSKPKNVASNVKTFPHIFERESSEVITRPVGLCARGLTKHV